MSDQNISKDSPEKDPNFKPHLDETKYLCPKCDEIEMIRHKNDYECLACGYYELSL